MYFSEDGATTASERTGSGYQTLLLIGMISLRTRSPYLACLYRCFLPADIWFLGNPTWCEEQSQMETRFILVRDPKKRVKALRPVATLVLLVFSEIAITM